MLRKVITSTLASVAMVAGSLVLFSGPAEASFSVGGTATLNNGTPVASYYFNDVDDSITICDLRADDLMADGFVYSFAPGTDEMVLEIGITDDTADGSCVTASKDLAEGEGLVVGVQTLHLDGTYATPSAADWAIA
jgi:hypothetical protein